MNIGADIPLYQHEEQLRQILEYARQPGAHLYLAGKRHPKQTFSVTNYCEKHYLTEKVSFFPYYDICRKFPILKKDCDVWFERTADLSAGVLKNTLPPKNRYVLFATMFHPMKDEGNSVVIRHWLDIFRHQGYKIHLLYYGIDAKDMRNKKEGPLDACCDKLFSVPVVSYSVGCNQNGLNVHVDDWCGPEVIDTVKELVAEYPYDVCFTNYTFFTSIFEYCHAYTEKIVLTHDSFLNRNRKLLAQGFSESCWMSVDAAGEKLACSRSNKVIALQKEESAYFSGISPETTLVDTIPPLCAPVTVQYPPRSGGKLVVGYLGSGNYVNETNLSLFIMAAAQDEVLQSTLRLRIAGGVSKTIYDFCHRQNFGTLEHELVGQVDDLQDFYVSCDVVINPERGGTGIKIKTLDAMAHGAAIVCTAAASAGTGSSSSFHNAEDVAGLIPRLRLIAEQILLVDELRNYSQYVYANLVSEYTRRAELMLTSTKAIVTEGVPLISEGKDAYFLRLFEDLLKHTGVAGKTIIEVGSDYNLVMAHLCLANGAEHVYACNPWLPSPEALQLPRNLDLMRYDFALCKLPPHSVDLVFCIATLEHFMDVEAVSSKMLEILKPDGKIFLQGEPFWTCSVGHHLWATKNTSIPGGYTFSGNNPVDNWAHMVLSPDEMRAALGKKVGTTIAVEEDIEPIVDSIYFSSTSNKLLPSDILRELGKSFYYTTERSLDVNEPNQYYTVAAKTIAEEDLRCSGLKLFGRPKNSLEAREMEDLVSVIVPCYNVQEFVGECLDSILAQCDIPIEIILVDDKSTDATLDILNRYTVYHPNVTLCRHDYNLGLGPARNTGVKAASGKYLFFLDSDDILASDTAIAELVAKIKKEKCPVVVSSCRKLLLSGTEEDFDEKQRAQWGGNIDTALPGIKAFCGAYLLERDIFVPMRAWGILFDSAFYKQHDFSFPPGAHEDLATIPFIYAMADNVYYSSIVAVVYRERSNSLSNTAWTKTLCANASLNWSVIQRNLKLFSLDGRTPEVAASVLGHNTYKIITNGLENLGVEAFFDSAQYIASSVFRKIDQQQFDSVFYMVRALKNIAPSEESYAKIAGCFHYENLLEFYFPNGTMRKIGECIIRVPKTTNQNNDELKEVFQFYNAHCPSSVKKHPAMLTEGDRAAYYYYASKVKGSGAVIDTGCFIGGTTHALVEGLRHDSSAAYAGRKVYVYDLFKVDDGYIRQWLKEIFDDDVTDATVNFRNFFDKMTEPFKAALEVHEGDICEIGYSYNRPIAFLGLDCCKTLAITDSVIRNFFPHLVPDESVVIHQDYIHVWHPYIHISMELLSEYFEPLVEIDWGGSYVWKCVKQITPTSIERIFGPSDAPSEKRFAWYSDYERNDILLQKKQKSLLYSNNQMTLSLARAIYLKSMGLKDAARQLGIETLEQYANYCTVDSLEENLRLGLNLDEYSTVRFDILHMKRAPKNTEDTISDFVETIQAEHGTGNVAAARALTAAMALELAKLQEKKFPARLNFLKIYKKVYSPIKIYIKKHKYLYAIAIKAKQLLASTHGASNC